MSEDQAKTALHMRDAGRTWKDVAAALGVTVPAARLLVAGEKAERRHGLARTETNERARGLLNLCECGHKMKEHGGEKHGGACATCGPVRETTPEEYLTTFETRRGCDAFDVALPREDDDALRRAVLRDQVLERRGKFRLSIDALHLDIPERVKPRVNRETNWMGTVNRGSRGGYGDNPGSPPTARLKTLVARAKRKAKRGRK